MQNLCTDSIHQQVTGFQFPLRCVHFLPSPLAPHQSELSSSLSLLIGLPMSTLSLLQSIFWTEVWVILIKMQTRMSIPQLKSFSTGFSGLSRQRILNVASEALLDLPLKAVCPCSHDLWPPWLFSFMNFCLCGSLCLESSAFVSPTHHPLPTNFYASFRSQCKSASPEKSYQISLNRSCPSLYALRELDIFLLIFSRFIIIFPSPGDLPNPGIEPTLQVDSLPATNQGIVVL